VERNLVPFYWLHDVIVLQPHTTVNIYQNVVEYFLLDLKAD